MDKKVKMQQEITEIVYRLKRQGKKVTTFNGSFDILHIGHVKSLKEAKSKGDVLIVLVNSDESIKKGQQDR
jgi:bifunctional ADP-heptose synthase (sugar kinase/adenylyltransferase)